MRCGAHGPNISHSEALDRSMKQIPAEFGHSAERQLHGYYPGAVPTGSMHQDTMPGTAETKALS